MSVRSGLSRAALAAGLLGSLAAPAFAQTAPASGPDTVFVLGRLNSTAYDSEGQAVAKAGVDAEEMRTFNTQTVDDAIDLIPGANSSNTGGSRNERLLFVRGFDRFQTTRSIDGVRVFLPADNRIDFGRFLTADLAEIQVAKGYVSVLDGPGGLGGSVNLVTRKPSRAFEAEVDATVTNSGNHDFDWTGNTLSALLGTKQDRFYAQVSGDVSRRGDDYLSEKFKPSVTSRQLQGRLHAQRYRRVRHQLYPPVGREKCTAARFRHGQHAVLDMALLGHREHLLHLEHAAGPERQPEDPHLSEQVSEPAVVVRRRDAKNADPAARIQFLLRRYGARRGSDSGLADCGFEQAYRLDPLSRGRAQ
jgi:outer membrane receptor protein involved in Fe transport